MRPVLVVIPFLMVFVFVLGPLIFVIEPCTHKDCVFKDSFNAGYFLAITLTTVGCEFRGVVDCPCCLCCVDLV